MKLRGWTPELIPDVTPADFAEIVSTVGWESARAELGVSDKTIGRWLDGLGIPQPVNQQKIKALVSRTRYEQVLGRRRD
jgi:hypothetical protein